MYRVLISGVFLLISGAMPAQDARNILQRSFERCQSIQEGYYEMTHLMRYMGEKDTLESTFECHFRKLDGDSAFPSAFHYRYSRLGHPMGEVLYTGEDFVTANSKDSSGTVMSKMLWLSQIQDYAHNYTFFSPFTSTNSSPLPNGQDAEGHLYKYLGKEKINGLNCHHIQVDELPEPDSSDQRVLRASYHFWIERKRLLPMQYDFELDYLLGTDTLFQYDRSTLRAFDIDHTFPDSILTLGAIPGYYRLADYHPFEKPALLPRDTLAPLWTLPSLDGKTVGLADLRGSLVVVDFFYKSCAPCMLALPGLQALHEKHAPRGLKVIGIDPYDKNVEVLAEFLGKRGISYTVLLGTRELAKAYHVSGYPVLYVIDGDGKVVHVQEGYAKGMEAQLEAVIEAHLK